MCAAAVSIFQKRSRDVYLAREPNHSVFLCFLNLKTKLSLVFQGRPHKYSLKLYRSQAERNLFHLVANIDEYTTYSVDNRDYDLNNTNISLIIWDQSNVLFVNT